MRRLLKGFTLVELLVVIAIIGILAGMLFPAIAGAMANSKATKVGSDGKQIWLMLYAENTDRVALNLAEVWPQASMAGAYATSHDYFSYAMDSTNNWLSGLPTAMLSAPGLTPGSSWTNLAAANVAWCLVRDLSSGTPADTPFLFTKNMSKANNAYPATGDRLDQINQFHATGKPFGDTMGVVVTWGGSIRVIKQKMADTTAKFQDVFNPNDNTTYTILSPGA